MCIRDRSARGQGEPLTGKLTLPPGATVDHMLMESDDQKLLMASDAGYGFVCTFNDLVARNRAGKALITLPENAHVMPPVVIEEDVNKRQAHCHAALRFVRKTFPRVGETRSRLRRTATALPY